MTPDDIPPGPPPYVEINGPERAAWRVELRSSTVRVGRLPGENDIVLAPDPYRYVTGRSHFTIALERAPLREWYVVDEQSRNGTFLRNGSEMFEVRERELL